MNFDKSNFLQDTFKQIIGKVTLINLHTKHDLFFRMSPQVCLVSLAIYLGGWEEDKDYETLKFYWDFPEEEIKTEIKHINEELDEIIRGSNLEYNKSMEANNE